MTFDAKTRHAFRYANDPEYKQRCLDAQKKWRDANRLKEKERSLKYWLEDPIRRLLIYSKSRAKVANLEFNLSKEDIIIPEKCPYLGIELLNIIGDRSIKNKISLDRIDSSLGYIKGNVQVISWQANCMKNNASKEELIEFAKGVLKIHG